MYKYNLGLKQNIIVTLDDYLLLWWLRNCFSKKRMYKYILRLKKSLGNTRLGLSMGQVGSGLGLTWTWLDWIGLPKLWPATDLIYGLDSAVRVIDWMGRIRRLGGFGLRIGPNLWVYSIFDRPFGPKLMGLLLTKIYLYFWTMYIYHMGLFSHPLFQIGPSCSACMPLHNFESFGSPGLISLNLIFLVHI